MRSTVRSGVAGLLLVAVWAITACGAPVVPDEQLIDVGDAPALRGYARDAAAEESASEDTAKPWRELCPNAPQEPPRVPYVARVFSDRFATGVAVLVWTYGSEAEAAKAFAAHRGFADACPTLTGKSGSTHVTRQVPSPNMPQALVTRMGAGDLPYQRLLVPTGRYLVAVDVLGPKGVVDRLPVGDIAAVQVAKLR